VSAARVLVTGGAGFLGVHLARELARQGDQVRILDAAPGPAWAAALGVDYRLGDVRDPAAVGGALENVDALIHAGFTSPHRPAAEIHSVNVDGTRNVLAQASARGLRRVVLVSSTIVLSPPRPHPLLTGSALSRLDAYRASRVAAENVAEAESRGNLSLAVVRPKTFVGPERVGAFAIVFERIHRGLAVPVFGTGANRYQLLDVRDLAEGLRRLLHAEATGRFGFGASQFTTVARDLQALIDHAGTASRLRFVSPRAARLLLRAIELAGLPPLSEWHHASACGEDSVIDTSRAERELGWHPQRDNRQALCDAYDWYRRAMESEGSAPTTHVIPRAHRALERLIGLLR